MGKSSSKLSTKSLVQPRSVSSGSLNAQLTHELDNEHLLDIFYQEVEVSDCMQTLIRGNCLASKIMSHCFRTFGSKYLKQLLEPHVNEINTTPISYEIDSTRLEEDGDLDINRRNLLKLTKQILDSILSSAADFPPQLNSMCICLRQVLGRKYPNSTTSNLKAVGTVIFLRFINPAIVSPYEAGIVDTSPPPRSMRGLMLVSKILQNIANNVEFAKEEHMLPFNDFVREHFEPMRKWVSEISSDSNKAKIQ